MSVFRNVFLRWCGLCYISLRCCGKDSPSMSPSLLYHKPFRNCNAFCKSKKKTNLLCLLTTSFNIARFGHENEVRRKALKPGKKWNPALFGIWNPLCWNPESSTRNPESTSWNPESKTVLDSLTWGDFWHGLILAWQTKVFTSDLEYLKCCFDQVTFWCRNDDYTLRFW